MRVKVRARGNGKPPPSATAWANPATSLTRVIGPCRIGIAGAVRDGQGRSLRQRPRRPAQRRFRPQIARMVAWTIPPTVTILAGQSIRKGRVLPDRNALAITPADLVAHHELPRRALVARPLPAAAPARPSRAERKPSTRHQPTSQRLLSHSHPSGRSARAIPHSAATRVPEGSRRPERRPAAPAATHPAATFKPIPPRTQTGRLPCASAACMSTNDDSAPPGPPLRCRRRSSRPTPAAIARRASARDVTSARTRRPDACMHLNGLFKLRRRHRNAPGYRNTARPAIGVRKP